MADDTLETVAFVYDQPQLALLLSLFESERIRVAAAASHHASVQWDWTVALGGVALRVHEADAEAARSLLAQVDPGLSPRPIFSEVRLIEALLILCLFLVGFFAPPARIPAHFLLEARTAAVRED